MDTRTIGLFEAKTHLSELVARAERGDEVIITRHNKPVAKLVPIADAPTFDQVRRQAAILAMTAVREEMRSKHGTITTEEIVSWVREGRDERDDRVWRAATAKKR